MQEYHYMFIKNLSRQIDLKDKRVLELGCGNGEVTRYIAENCGVAHIVGTDMMVEREKGSYVDSDFFVSEGTNWSIQEGDAMELPFEDRSFDVVISVASFEHISDIGRTLREIRRVLKEGGYFYTDFGPIWSSIIGHHCCIPDGKNWELEDSFSIPPWGHLYLSEEEMNLQLQKTLSPEKAEILCREIYHDPWINRIGVREMEKIFLSAGMRVVKLQKNTLKNRRGWTSGETEDEFVPDILQRMEKPVTREDLYVSGFEVILQKRYEKDALFLPDGKKSEYDLQDVREMQAVITGLQTEITNLQAQLNNRQDQLNNHQDQLNDHQNQLNDHQGQLNDRQNQLNGHQEALNDHQSQLNRCQEKLQQHQGQLEDYRERLDDQRRRLDHEQERLNDYQNQLNDQRRSRDSLAVICREMQDRMEQLERESDRVQGILNRIPNWMKKVLNLFMKRG